MPIQQKWYPKVTLVSWGIRCFKTPAWEQFSLLADQKVDQNLVSPSTWERNTNYLKEHAYQIQKASSLQRYFQANFNTPLSDNPQ